MHDFHRDSGDLLETAHAVAHVRKLAPTLGNDKVIVLNLSGRGDKDVSEVRKILAERERKTS